MPKRSAIKTRLNEKLLPADIVKIRPALLSHLDLRSMDPAKVRCNMDFVKLFMSDLADYDSCWDDVTLDDIKSTNAAIV